MTIIPVVDAEEIVTFLKSRGFLYIRQKGSHLFFRHPDGRTATVPLHKGEDIGRGLMRKILKDCEISIGEFLAWRKKKL